MSLKYILFDLDGTLTDPGVGITTCVNYALSEFGKGVDDLTELYKYIGPPLVSSLMEFHGFTEEQALVGLKIYRKTFREEGIFKNDLFPAIPGVLNRLKEQGYTLILATSKPQEFAKIILEHFDLYKYFDFIGGNNLQEERPSKQLVLEYIIENYPDVCHDTAIMVGDRRYDTEGAAALGMDTIGVLYGYGSLEEHKTAGTKYLAHTPEDILSIINSIK